MGLIMIMAVHETMLGVLTIMGLIKIIVNKVLIELMEAVNYMIGLGKVHSI